MTLTKADIVDALNERIGLSKTQATDIVELIFEEMKGSLSKGDGVKISGFGNFDVRFKRERKGRNPKTGEPMMLPSRQVVTFQISKVFRDTVTATLSDSDNPKE